MNGIGWVMAAHVITLGMWSAGLLVLAGLYASPRGGASQADVHRHSVMCRYVYVVLASPSAILAIISGSALVAMLGVEGSWLLAKLAVVVLLALFHAYCGHLLHAEGHETTPERRTPWRSPLLIFIPFLLISTIFFLVLAKPDIVFEYQVTAKPASYRHKEGAQERQVQAAAMDGAQRIVETR